MEPPTTFTKYHKTYYDTHKILLMEKKNSMKKIKQKCSKKNGYIELKQENTLFMKTIKKY